MHCAAISASFPRITQANPRNIRYHPRWFAIFLIMFSNLRDDIRSIIQRDPAARNGWEVLTCYPGLHAVIDKG